MLSLKKRGGVGDKQKEPGGRKPNANHHCEEENDAAFGPIIVPRSTTTITDAQK
jgi:hypothetical protein